MPTRNRASYKSGERRSHGKLLSHHHRSRRNKREQPTNSVLRKPRAGQPDQGDRLLSGNLGQGRNRRDNLPLVAASTVRRLTPRECERLMGFPDDWTRIPWRGRPAEQCPDSPRYKACGNSMCVNVMRWIGMKIEMAERKMRWA